MPFQPMQVAQDLKKRDFLQLVLCIGGIGDGKGGERDALMNTKNKRPVKWRNLSRTGKIGSGKNTKYLFSYWA